MPNYPANNNWNNAPFLDGASVNKLCESANSSNGLYRYLRRGTILGTITANNKVRPSAVTDIASADAAAVGIALTAQDVANFFTGDTVTFFNSSGFSTPGTLTVGVTPTTITFRPRVNDGLAHSLSVTDVVGKPPKVVATVAVDGTVTAVASLDAAGGDTVQDLLDVLAEGYFGSMFISAFGVGAAGEIIVASAAVPLTNVFAANAAIANRVITKTGSTLSWTGAIDLNMVDYAQVADGSETPVGVLQEDLVLFNSDVIDGDVAIDRVCSVGVFGVVRSWNILLGANSGVLRGKFPATIKVVG